MGVREDSKVPQQPPAIANNSSSVISRPTGLGSNASSSAFHARIRSSRFMCFLLFDLLFEMYYQSGRTHYKNNTYLWQGPGRALDRRQTCLFDVQMRCQDILDHRV